MSVLIVGVGLVGAQVARLLIERGERPVLLDVSPQQAAIASILDLSGVTIVRGSVLKPFDLWEAIQKHRPSAVVHMAANPMLTVGAQREPYQALELNIMGSLNVFEAARIAGIAKVVVASSSVLNHFMAGGEDGGDTLCEEALPRPTTFYAASKQAVESIAANYAKWHAIDITALRYGPVAGPWIGSGGGGPSAAFAFAVQNALAGRPVEAPPGAMEWVYSKDAARSVMLALDQKLSGFHAFNITGNAIYAPDDFHAAFRAVFPKAIAAKATSASSSAPVPEMRASNPARSAQLLAYRPEYDLVAAIEDYVSWLKQTSTS